MTVLERAIRPLCEHVFVVRLDKPVWRWGCESPASKGVATRGDPESCAGVRESVGEALTGARAGWVIEPRNQWDRGADAVTKGGRQHRQRYRELSLDPTTEQLDDLQPDRVFISGRQQPGSNRTQRRLQRYRTGAEGRISHLKRGYGMHRSRLKGDDGQKTWTGWGILTYNLDTLTIQTA